MFFLKRKQRVSSEELAQKLAVSFSAAIGEELSDKSRLDWLWEAFLHPNIELVRREWVLVHMFLRCLAFRHHSQDRKGVETLLDHFHGFALQSLGDDGVISMAKDFETLLHQRYQDYYEAMRGSKELQFQVMKVAERFFHHCGSVSVEAVLVATDYFLRALVAEKNLIQRLEKDAVFVP